MNRNNSLRCRLKQDAVNKVNRIDRDRLRFGDDAVRRFAPTPACWLLATERVLSATDAPDDQRAANFRVRYRLASRNADLIGATAFPLAVLVVHERVTAHDPADSVVAFVSDDRGIAELVAAENLDVGQLAHRLRT